MWWNPYFIYLLNLVSYRFIKVRYPYISLYCIIEAVLAQQYFIHFLWKVLETFRYIFNVPHRWEYHQNYPFSFVFSAVCANGFLSYKAHHKIGYCTKNGVLYLSRCGHMCCCTTCSSHLTSCPLCRKRIDQVVKTFRHWYFRESLTIFSFDAVALLKDYECQL